MPIECENMNFSHRVWEFSERPTIRNRCKFRLEWFLTNGTLEINANSTERVFKFVHFMKVETTTFRIVTFTETLQIDFRHISNFQFIREQCGSSSHPFQKLSHFSNKSIPSLFFYNKKMYGCETPTVEYGVLISAKVTITIQSTLLPMLQYLRK